MSKTNSGTCVCPVQISPLSKNEDNYINLLETFTKINVLTLTMH